MYLYQWVVKYWTENLTKLICKGCFLGCFRKKYVDETFRVDSEYEHFMFHVNVTNSLLMQWGLPTL